jgi:hypothetical protein
VRICFPSIFNLFKPTFSAGGSRVGTPQLRLLQKPRAEFVPRRRLQRRPRKSTQPSLPAMPLLTTTEGMRPQNRYRRSSSHARRVQVQRRREQGLLRRYVRNSRTACPFSLRPVSLVDGYNLPMRIDNNVGCGIPSCPVDLGPNCAYSSIPGAPFVG